jgi:tRNA(Ile)-lysidine synthase
MARQIGVGCYNPMPMDVCDRVEAAIREHGLLRRGQRVVAAVSGGADSLCLLDCLHRLNYPIVVAHLNHKLRPGSEADAEFVLHLAQRYGLPAVIASEDVRAQARAQSLEAAARRARYRFLARVAREHRIRVIATGHTADDQAETVLLHLLRGAGPAGLRGIVASTALDAWAEIPEGTSLLLVRPLLEISREETRAYCSLQGLDPRKDPTNEDPAFLRNRIRLQLLPELETYNPGIRKVLTRTARVMGEHAEWIEAQVADVWPDVVRSAGKDALALRLSPFGRLPAALRGEVVRRALLSLRPEGRDFGQEDIARTLAALAGSGPRRVSLGFGLEVERFGEEAVLHGEGAELVFPQYPQMTTLSVRPIRWPSAIRLANGWRLVIEEKRLTLGTRRALLDHPEPHTAAFDRAGLLSPLRLRPPRPGDRLQPLGMKGTARITQIFADRHVPGPARARWPILAVGESPLWVIGLRLGSEARINPSSRVALLFRLTPPQAD